MGVQRINRLLRLVIVLQSESQGSPEELVQSMEVSRRTLYRDIKVLQEVGIPCYYDSIERRYRIKDSFYMPPSRLTDKEAFGLLLLIRKAEALMELPFNAAIQRAAIKIRNALPSDIRLMCRRKLNNISIRSTGKKQKSLDKCFEALQQAIQKRKILSITYCSKYEDEIITADFSPFHLIYTNEWYVMGKINISRQIQSIKLKSIKKIEETKRCFLNEEEFDPSYYIGRAWATIPEGRLYNIQLKFASEIAQDVTSVKWHDTQYAMVEEDGSAIMEFRVDGLNEITWWILGFGDKVEVLKPEVLRKKIHEIAEKMVQKT